jgi:hypothetical protein
MPSSTPLKPKELILEWLKFRWALWTPLGSRGERHVIRSWLRDPLPLIIMAAVDEARTCKRGATLTIINYVDGRRERDIREFPPRG